MNCEEFENLMDDFFHHHLSFKMKRQFRKHLQTCSDCQKLYNDFETVMQGVKNLEMQSCPDGIVAAVFNILNLDRQSKYQISLINKFAEYLPRYRFEIGVVGAVITIIFILIFAYPRLYQKSPVKEQYSNAQIEQAKNDVKLALSYFNQITSRTQKIIEEQVLPQQVIAPMKSSIQTAIKPLMNGGES